jgi:hypothetical protein
MKIESVSLGRQRLDFQRTINLKPSSVKPKRDASGSREKVYNPRLSASRDPLELSHQGGINEPF